MARRERRPGARGFETYYLGRARTEESRRVAMRENAVIELEGENTPSHPDQLEFILAGIDRDANLDLSFTFGGYIQNGLRRVLGGVDRGVKSAPFYVLLTTTSMPTVLVELGFITNPDDERRLTDSAVQREIARALADAIEGYLAETGRRIAVMEGRG
jgi:N-acetylmuramoyl-L-alanine amidase